MTSSKHSYERSGSGRPIVLLHGWGASLRAWDGLLPQLHAAGYETFAADLLGHGDSLKAGVSGDYHIESYYQHLINWLDEIKLDKPFDLIGHSTGGYLSLLFAHRNPDSVRRLVLVDPLYQPSQLSPMVKASIERPGFSTRAKRAVPDWLVQSAAKFSSKINRGMSAGVTEQMAADFQRSDPLIAHTPGTIDDLFPLLPKIATETLVIWGKQDLTLSPNSFPKLVEALPNGRGLPINGTGHTPHMTHVEQVGKAITNFFS